MRRILLLAGLTAVFAEIAVRNIQPVVETESMSQDVDDPAIWVHPRHRARSLIVGTIKRPKPDGGLAVWNLEGKLLESYRGIDRPNNVDILGDRCVVAERLARQLRVYRVHETRPHLRPIGNVLVFAGEEGEQGAPMGIALYSRAKDKALFAIVSRKTGPSGSYLWQYRLHFGSGRVHAEKVRAFGEFSGMAEIEAVAVDHEKELIYYSDEDCCVRVYRANPDAPDASKEVARFAESGFEGNREGIAIAGPYLIVTEQLETASEYHVYRREDWRELAVWRGTARKTDGIDAIAMPMGPRFPRGLLVAMSEARRNFQLYALP